jgi:hypothetical protein
MPHDRVDLLESQRSKEPANAPGKIFLIVSRPTSSARFGGFAPMRTKNMAATLPEKHSFFDPLKRPGKCGPSFGITSHNAAITRLRLAEAGELRSCAGNRSLPMAFAATSKPAAMSEVPTGPFSFACASC